MPEDDKAIAEARNNLAYVCVYHSLGKPVRQRMRFS
jgi:hypothetical protein